MSEPTNKEIRDAHESMPRYRNTEPTIANAHDELCKADHHRGLLLDRIETLTAENAALVSQLEAVREANANECICDETTGYFPDFCPNCRIEALTADAKLVQEMSREWERKYFEMKADNAALVTKLKAARKGLADIKYEAHPSDSIVKNIVIATQRILNRSER